MGKKMNVNGFYHTNRKIFTSKKVQDRLLTHFLHMEILVLLWNVQQKKKKWLMYNTCPFVIMTVIIAMIYIGMTS